jgi:hypothetical protein
VRPDGGLQQAGKGGVELITAQPVEPPGAIITLLDQPGGAQNGEVMAPRGLADRQAEESLDLLSRLAATLLDVTRLQAGARSVFPRPADLQEIIACSLASLGPSAGVCG